MIDTLFSFVIGLGVGLALSVFYYTKLKSQIEKSTLRMREMENNLEKAIEKYGLKEK